VDRATQRRVVVGVLALALLLGMGPGPAQHVALADPELGLNPASGESGSTVTVEGTGFPRDAKGRLV
jgi:hypothetical protein